MTFKKNNIINDWRSYINNRKVFSKRKKLNESLEIWLNKSIAIMWISSHKQYMWETIIFQSNKITEIIQKTICNERCNFIVIFIRRKYCVLEHLQIPVFDGFRGFIVKEHTQKSFYVCFNVWFWICVYLYVTQILWVLCLKN